MKRLFATILLCVLMLSGCTTVPKTQIAATTLPVYQFAQELCQGTDLAISRVVTEPVSCLHDYSLTVDQMRTVEGAEVLVMSGAGLEDFLDSALESCETVIDASQGIELLPGEEGQDPHFWLSPTNAMVMAENICDGLSEVFPQQEETIRANLEILLDKLQKLDDYGRDALSNLSCRNLITFHDGFSYFAQAYDLNILAAVEEEAGSEVSSEDMISLVQLVQQEQLPAIFTETNGSTSAAQVIAAETQVNVFTLDMAMAGDDYFAAMTHNFDTIREAFG